jgi:hypothetical protein
VRLRKAIASLLFAALTVTVAAPPARGAGSLPLYLNGRALDLPAPPVIVQDRTLVPLRGYMEALGAQVYWQPPDTITVQWEDRTVTLRLGDKDARVGTSTVQMDVPAQLIDSRTYVPLRFLSEGLGAQVSYDGKAVYVTSPVGSRVVVDGPLNVRSQPSTSAPILVTVPIGTHFTVLSGGPEWTQVVLPGGLTGWVASRFTEPLPSRPPFDPFAEMLKGPTGYLQVQGKCMGEVPNWDGQIYAPLGPAVAKLGGTLSEGVARVGDHTWSVPDSAGVHLGGEMFLPVRTLAQHLGLTVAWDGSRQTARLDVPGASYSTEEDCNPVSSAGSYVIMDARSGLILSEQRADQSRPIASITKIMTGLLALERGDLDSMVNASRSAAGQIGTSMGLRTGDQVRLRDMLYGLMLPSGNDAAAAIAEHLAGTEPAFARLMTGRAAQLGATSTLFYNASGLDDWVNPYSTARDMALIAREATKIPEFRAVMSTREYRFNGPRGPWILKNKNEFVSTYPGATGVKNGWTEKAGYTLVASAYRNGVELIVVVLGATQRDQVYAEATRLMDQGFKLDGNAWLLSR